MTVGYILLFCCERKALLRNNRKPLMTDKRLVIDGFKLTMHCFIFFHSAMLVFLLNNFSEIAKKHQRFPRGEDIIPNGNFAFAGGEDAFTASESTSITACILTLYAIFVAVDFLELRPFK